MCVGEAVKCQNQWEDDTVFANGGKCLFHFDICKLNFGGVNFKATYYYFISYLINPKLQRFHHFELETKQPVCPCSILQLLMRVVGHATKSV